MYTGSLFNCLVWHLSNDAVVRNSFLLTPNFLVRTHWLFILDW